MNITLLATHIGIPVEEVQELLDLGQAQIYQSSFYRNLIDSLDYHTLSGTIPEVRAAYDTRLPELVDFLRKEHQFQGKPMTAVTLSNWILGFLHNPHYLSKLADFHHKVPMEILEFGLPGILDILDDVGPAGQEWKRAMVLLSLPLFAAT